MSSRRSPGRASILIRTGSLVFVFFSAGGWSTGCLSRPVCDEDCRPRTTNVILDSISGRVDKIDLLFMIDNSISMSDKQVLLKKAVPDLVERLVNPACVDNETNVAGPAPQSPSDRCPPGSSRQFEPVTDIHIGVLSSSLGSSVSGACRKTEDQNDLGHLIGARPRAFEQGVALASMPEGTPGFLAWGRGQDLEQLKNTFSELVTAVDDEGCGYEASLESWYRFLVDPKPPLDYQKVPCANGNECAEPVGRDEALLAQRAGFLRPDSLLAIIMLSDENDCSIRPDGPFYLASEPGTLPRAATVCAENPNDRCCYSCGTQPPDGCTPDPICESDAKLESMEDHPNLRCFEQKRRFGFDFLYPTSRYVRALSSLQICTSHADLDPEGCPSKDLVTNPLLVGPDGTRRPPSLVFLAGIIGVPWQDIRSDVDAEGNPVAPGEFRFKTAAQMQASGTWDIVLGDPNAGPPQPPLDPLMIESVAQRSGENPVTGDALEPASAGPGANPINGHEWNVLGNDDLQYACIFPLREGSRVCTGEDCDCTEGPFPQSDLRNPLCQDPMTGEYGNTQFFAKAYPGTRHLQVLKDFGENSIVASICASKVASEQEADPDFGYRPAIAAIVGELGDALSGACLSRELKVIRDDGELVVPCKVVEAVPKPGLGCTQAGRTKIDADLVEPSLERLAKLKKCGVAGRPPCDHAEWTLCEIVQSESDSDGSGIADCLEDIEPSSAGWCYVDPEKGLGEEALVERCDPTKKRLLRFVDPVDPIPAPGATLLIACLGAGLDVAE